MPDQISPEANNHESLMLEAMTELQHLQDELERFEQEKNEPIAIIGMGCRFPGGINTPADYWQLLAQGIDAITDIPAERWDVDQFYDPDPDAVGKMYTRQGGFLTQVDRFDPQFFGISPREAAAMDPQHRLLLEVSWEALENSGVAINQLLGSQTGVFVGLCVDAYVGLAIHSKDLTQLNPYSSLGNIRSIAAGRIAYTLGLQGPTLQLDTSCSSSLLTMHLACQSLRNRECDLALSGGVNLILSPESMVGFCRLKALSPDGRSKTFDASANGYARGEGCGIVVLKRLSDALADGDNILALIRGSAVNHDGKSNGLTAPNGSAQETVIRQALVNAGRTAKQLDYVEAHGTGTSLGDPIEILALSRVLGERTSNPLPVGSVKTNFGHLEGAAGVAGLMKVVLALQHGQIPPHLHFDTPNPHIPWGRLPVTIPTELTDWPTSDEEKLAGVSSFGMSGTNLHIILSDAPSSAMVDDNLSPKPLPKHHILTLSAKTTEALHALVSRYINHLERHPDLDIAQLCATTNTGRAHFKHRFAVVAQNRDELLQKLQAINEQNQRSSHLVNQPHGHTPDVAFLFTGQGSQYINMGRNLYETEPVFRHTIDTCHQILAQIDPTISLLDTLYPDLSSSHNQSQSDKPSTLNDGIENKPQLVNRKSEIVNQTAYTQPALFAIEYALAQLWQTWGITPDYVLGHSVGELVAACVAGVFTLEDGLKLVAARGRLMQNLSQQGRMVSVAADEAVISNLIAPYRDSVSIAAINGPQTIVISGEATIIETLTAQLDSQGIKTTALNTSHAFHSPLMQPMLADFEQIATQITYQLPHINLVSNVTGQLIGQEICQPSYWVKHIIQPVQFTAGIAALLQAGANTFIEIGPKPTLITLGQLALSEATSEMELSTWLPSLRPKKPDQTQLLESLGQLYRQGADINWANVAERQPKVILPNYPFQRQRYWIDSEPTFSAQPSDSLLQPDQIVDPEQISQLTDFINQSAGLTAQEQALLPKVLEQILAYQTQQTVAPAAWHRWLYQITWQARPQFDLPPVYLSKPEAIYSRLMLQAHNLLTQPDIQTYQEAIRCLELLSLDYLLVAFEKAGLTLEPEAILSFDYIAQTLKLRPYYERLLTYFLNSLCDQGILQPNDHQHWQVIQRPEYTSISETVNGLKAQYNNVIGPELALLQRCGEALPKVLAGQQDPLTLLFPHG
ncbi:MAG: type I polyketide synthase, partial [Chloroflexota bacterium]